MKPRTRFDVIVVALSLGLAGLGCSSSNPLAPATTVSFSAAMHSSLERVQSAIESTNDLSATARLQAHQCLTYAFDDEQALELRMSNWQRGQFMPPAFDDLLQVLGNIDYIVMTTPGVSTTEPVTTAVTSAKSVAVAWKDSLK
jgi:hypothetical protein